MMLWLILLLAAACFVLYKLPDEKRAAMSAAVRTWLDERRTRTAKEEPKLADHAEWTKPTELPTRQVDERPQLVVGLTSTGERVLSPPDTPMIAIGSTRSGKGRGIMVPNILAWKGGVLASTTKVDLIRETLAWRRRQGGNVGIYDPSGTLPDDLAEYRVSWTPLAACFVTDHGVRRPDFAAAYEVAATLISAGTDKNDKDPFWSDSAALLLAPLLFHEAVCDGTMRNVNKWLARLTADAQVQGPPAEGELDWSLPGLISTLEDMKADGVLGADLAIEMALPISGYAPATAGSLVASANRALRAYKVGADGENLKPSDPRVYRPEDLFDGGTLYVSGPSYKQKLYKPLYTALVEYTVQQGFAHARSKRTERLDRSVLLALDEFPNTAPIPSLDAVITQAGGHGINFLAACHNVSQLRGAYGEQTADNVLSNCYGVAILPNVKDVATLKWVSEMTGEHRVESVTSVNESESSSRNRGELFDANTSTSKASTKTRDWRPLAAMSAVATMRENAMFAMIGRHRAMLVQNWYDQDPELSKRAGLPPHPADPLVAERPATPTVGEQRPTVQQNRFVDVFDD